MPERRDAIRMFGTRRGIRRTKEFIVDRMFRSLLTLGAVLFLAGAPRSIESAGSPGDLLYTTTLLTTPIGLAVIGLALILGRSARSERLAGGIMLVGLVELTWMFMMSFVYVPVSFATAAIALVLLALGHGHSRTRRAGLGIGAASAAMLFLSFGPLSQVEAPPTGLALAALGGLVTLAFLLFTHEATGHRAFDASAAAQPELTEALTDAPRTLASAG